MSPLLNSLPETVFTTKVDDLLNWGRASSQWYMLFGLAWSRSGRTLGLGSWWANTGLVKRFPFLE